MDIYDETAIAEAAENGDVEAQLQYGKMLCGLADRLVSDECGWLDDVRIARYCDDSMDGIAWLEKAADSGNAEAADLLRGIKNGEIHLVSRGEYCYGKGMRYLRGDGTDKDLEHAEQLLLESAESGWVAAQREVAKLCLGLTDASYTEGRFCSDPKKWLEKAAKSGDGEAQHLLAMSECDGDLTDYPYFEDAFSAGLEWLKHSADQGNVISQYQYGRICFERSDEEILDAIAYWERAYANGLNSTDPRERSAAAMAALEIAELNYHKVERGDLFKPDGDRAIVWYEKAIELGSIDAADALSDIIYLKERDGFNWDGCEQHSEEFDKLFRYTKIAADGEYAYAKVRLAVLYAIGIGVAVDLDKALSLVRDAWIFYPHAAADKCLKMVNEQKVTIREALYACRNTIG